MIDLPAPPFAASITEPAGAVLFSAALAESDQRIEVLSEVAVFRCCGAAATVPVVYRIWWKITTSAAD